MGTVGVTRITETGPAAALRYADQGVGGDWLINHVDEAVGRRLTREVWSDGGFNILAHGANSTKFELSYTGIADFTVNFDNRTVAIRRETGATDSSIRHLLGDQVIPRILAHAGELVLHAAAVRRGQGIVLVVGLSGSGKSTLAASLHNRGYHLVGDDAIVVSTSEQGVVGRAVYRSLRLFPDSIEALVDDAADLTPVASYTTKQNVTFPDDDCSHDPLPVRAAFLLGPPRGDKIVVEPVTSSEACMAFVEHSFWMDPTDLAQTKQRMRKASALAGPVRTFRLAYPRDYVVLPAVREALANVLG